LCVLQLGQGGHWRSHSVLVGGVSDAGRFGAKDSAVESFTAVLQQPSRAYLGDVLHICSPEEKLLLLE
jgi:hypothetical protein